MTSLAICLTAMLFGNNLAPAKNPVTVSAATVVYADAQKSVLAEQQLIDMVNTERWGRKLGVLRPNPMLAEVARAHSREMAMLNYFDHFSPNTDFRSPMKRYLRTLGYTPSYACVSENLYYCTKYNVKRGHVALMNSPSHRANILSDKFDEVGVGCYIAPDGRLWVTEMFLKQVDQPSTYTTAKIQQTETKS